MDKKALSFLAFGIILGAVVSAAMFALLLNAERTGGRAGSSEGGQPRVVLKLAHVLEQTHPVHAGMVFMAERLAEISNGAMEIQIFPNGQLGSETECIEQVQHGGLDMLKTSTAAMEGFVPEMSVFGLPYLFRDEQHYWTVLNGPIGKELLAAGDTVGMHGLCYYDSGSRSFYTVSKPVLAPADVKGQKIRVIRSPMAMELITTFGGAPTPIPWGELYTALQQGTVDGAENNPPSFLSSRQYEVAKLYSLDEHTRIPDMVIFSKKRWDQLSPQQRAWLDQAAAESVDFQRKLWKEKTDEALAELQQKGVKVTRPDKAPFVAASQPMYKPYEGKPLGALAQRIREVK